MKRVYLILILVLVIQNATNAQYTIKGNITDENGVTVAFATIQLKQGDNKTIAYTTSTAEGNFSFTSDSYGNFSLVISHLSYKKNTTPIEIKEQNSLVDIDVILKSKTQELTEVTIQKSLTAAWEKGDTITYSTKAFTTGNEAKLKDVLNKLPGIEVNENGAIIANGKKVDNLLLDGKEFFGNNHGLATNNLSADMIAGVDLIKNYESFGALREIEQSKQTALNIKIKSDYKNKISGDLTAYGAIENRYRLHTNLFRFGKKLNLSFIGNINDTGEQAITLQDYLNLNTSVKDELRNSGSLNSEILSNIPDFLLSDANVQERASRFGALNFSYFPSGKLSINGYSIINRNSQVEQLSSAQRFLESNLTFSDTVTTRGKMLFNQTKINVDYQPNKNNLINYTLLIEPTTNDEARNVFSNFQDTRQTFEENKQGNNLKIGQQLSFISKIDRYELLSFNAFYERTSFDDDYSVISNQTLFNTSVNDLFQNKEQNFEEYGILAKYTRKINKNLLKIQLGAINRKETFTSAITETDFSNNDLFFKKNYLTGGISMEKNDDFFQYQLGFSLRKYNLSFSNTSNNSLFFLPDLKVKFEFDPTHNMELYYNRDVDFAPVKQLNEGDVIQDYRNLYVAANTNFENSLVANNAGFRYFYLNLFSGTLLLLNTGLSETKNFVALNSTANRFNTLNYQNSPENKSWFNTIMFETRYSAVKSKIRFNAGYFRTNGFNYLNSIENKVRNKTLSLKATVLSYFKEALFNYEAGFSYRNTNTSFSNLATENTNTVYGPFVNFDLSLSKNLQCVLKNNYEIFKTNNEQRELWNFSFRANYQKEKEPFTFFLEGNNVFNLTSPEVIEIRSNNNIFERNVLSRLAGYIGFGITYEF